MTAPYFSIKKYSSYQHYKTRNPPWIKLYRSILNDYEMRCLSVEARLAYVGLLIIASETDNHIPVDYKFISERLGFIVQESTLTPLINSGFLLASHAIRALARHALCSSLLSSDEEVPLNPASSLNLKSKKRAVKPNGVTNLTWQAYSAAYEQRYSVAPVRNSRVNGMLARFIEAMPKDEAPQVASFYITHNDPYYVRNRHPVNMLLQHAEGLRTQWATGTKATTGEAKQAEFKDSVIEQVKRVEALMQGRTA